MPTKPISITLPEELLELIDQQVESGQFASVSEFIRHCVRQELSRSQAVGDVTPGTATVGSATSASDSTRQHNTNLSLINSESEQEFALITSTWLTGKVQRGQQLGGKLGFPTLNLDPTLLPATVTHGVYAAQVEHADQIYSAAAHFGPRKTLGEWKPTLEFHLLDFDQHIPGNLVRFRLLEPIRSTLRFDSLDALKQQLAEDVAKVRKIFGKKS